MRVRRQTTVLFLLLCVMVTAFWIRHIQPMTTSLTTETNTPENYLENAHILVFNAQTGAPMQDLFSPRISYYPDKDEVKIIRPHYVFENQDGHHWQIDAALGLTNPEMQHIDLLQNVHIQLGQPPLLSHLKTQRLTIIPSKNSAETAEEVDIEQTGIHMHATGMSANFCQETLELRSKVQGDYDA